MNYKYIGILFILPLICHCGKHESTGGTVGAATGAVVGSAVSSKKNKGTGAVLGAIFGNYIGRKTGKSVDQKEEKIKKLEAQNEDLEKKLTKWCLHCNKKVSISNAQTCPTCGSKLIQEKFCERCKTTFEPGTHYRFCPYCSNKTKLESR